MEPPRKDLYLTCQTCRNRFLHTLEEQRKRYSAGERALPNVCPACRALDRLAHRRTGRIDWYSRQRRFGFIKQEDASSLFVHASSFRQPSPARPRQGMLVSYYALPTEKGARAVEVEILDEN